MMVTSGQALTLLTRNVRERTFGHVRPTKTQISLRIRAVWSESSLSTWKIFVSLGIKIPISEDSDQTALNANIVSIAWNIKAYFLKKKIKMLPVEIFTRYAKR